MAFGFGDPTSRRRDRARKRARGPLADYYAVRVPEDGTPASELRLLSLDFETTGLDPATSSLLSAGFVPVTCGSIELAGAGRLVVRGTAEVGQSATVHGLT